MNKFLLSLSGYGVVLEKTTLALQQANADNELLRNEIKKLRKENRDTNLAYEHQVKLYAHKENEIRDLQNALKSEEQRTIAAEEQASKVRSMLDEGVEGLQKVKQTIVELQQENSRLKSIADKAEEFREAHNRKRREKRARLKAERQAEAENTEQATTESNGEEG